MEENKNPLEKSFHSTEYKTKEFEYIFQINVNLNKKNYIFVVLNQKSGRKYIEFQTFE